MLLHEYGSPHCLFPCLCGLIACRIETSSDAKSRKVQDKTSLSIATLFYWLVKQLEIETSELLLFNNSNSLSAKHRKALLENVPLNAIQTQVLKHFQCRRLKTYMFAVEEWAATLSSSRTMKVYYLDLTFCFWNIPIWSLNKQKTHHDSEYILPNVGYHRSGLEERREDLAKHETNATFLAESSPQPTEKRGKNRCKALSAVTMVKS